MQSLQRELTKKEKALNEMQNHKKSDFEVGIKG